jgi:hypothetical protein
MPRVQSESVRWVGYDAKRKTLFVRFVDGDLCSYEGVERRLYSDFLKAKSKAFFVRERLQDKFVTRHLEDDWPEFEEETRALHRGL